eukprot:GHVS01034136.1.p2 GENE.GHVS01034136.1~~GHVS01034136.1.p2  ORF type:complete len:136 (-),score=13.80 GHVS01034136.1:794-1201(-)
MHDNSRILVCMPHPISIGYPYHYALDWRVCVTHSIGCAFAGITSQPEEDGEKKPSAILAALHPSSRRYNDYRKKERQLCVAKHARMSYVVTCTCVHVPLQTCRFSSSPPPDVPGPSTYAITSQWKKQTFNSLFKS